MDALSHQLTVIQSCKHVFIFTSTENDSTISYGNLLLIHSFIETDRPEIYTSHSSIGLQRSTKSHGHDYVKLKFP